MKYALEERLKRAEKRLGPDSFVVQQLRNQVHAHRTGKSFFELYTTGPVVGAERIEETVADKKETKPIRKKKSDKS